MHLFMNISFEVIHISTIALDIFMGEYIFKAEIVRIYAWQYPEPKSENEGFYPMQALVFGYCRCLLVSLCVCVC